MQIEAKAPPGKGSTTHVRKLTFTAESELDQVQLAALSLAWVNMAPSEALKQFRREAIEAHCTKYNVTVVEK
jgi:hypothetical protein